MRRLPEHYREYHESGQACLVRGQGDLDTAPQILQEAELQQVRAESHSSGPYY